MNFLKQDKTLPEAVLKNHSKSQKNHKMKKSKCVGLQISSSTQWAYNMECFSTFCYSYGEKHRSKITTKKYVLKHSILYAYCVELLIWRPTQFDFSFYDFSVIYYDLSKLLQGVICPVLESSGVKNPFSYVGWWCVPTRVFYPDRPDRTGEVRYRFTGSVRSGTGRKPDKFKFEFKPRSTIGSDRYTGLVPGRWNKKTELV
jgi:hypothetical protein